MLPCAEQCNWISAKAIPGVKRPAPPISTDALFAVVELIAVVVYRQLSIVDIDLQVARMELIPRFMAHLTYYRHTSSAPSMYFKTGFPTKPLLPY